MSDSLDTDLGTRPLSATFHVSSNEPNSRIVQSLSVKNCVHAPIGILNTQALDENQIKDFREHAHTCYFGCHGRTNFQRYLNFVDCHPSVPNDPFDHHATPAFSIVFGTAIPEAFHRLPCFRIYCICQRQFSSLLRHPNWPSDRLPERCVSRCHQSSR